jgi:hypothetical protein
MLQLRTVISKLDRNNRIRHLQGLPKINYDVLKVDLLCDRYKDDDYAASLIIKLIEQDALSRRN